MGTCMLPCTLLKCMYVCTHTGRHEAEYVVFLPGLVAGARRDVCGGGARVGGHTYFSQVIRTQISRAEGVSLKGMHCREQKSTVAGFLPLWVIRPSKAFCTCHQLLHHCLGPGRGCCVYCTIIFLWIPWHCVAYIHALCARQA